MPITPGLSAALRREKAARPPVIGAPASGLVRLKASRASARVESSASSEDGLDQGEPHEADVAVDGGKTRVLRASAGCRRKNSRETAKKSGSQASAAAEPTATFLESRRRGSASPESSPPSHRDRRCRAAGTTSGCGPPQLSFPPGPAQNPPPSSKTKWPPLPVTVSRSDSISIPPG